MNQEVIKAGNVHPTIATSKREESCLKDTFTGGGMFSSRTGIIIDGTVW